MTLMHQFVRFLLQTGAVLGFGWQAVRNGLGNMTRGQMADLGTQFGQKKGSKSGKRGKKKKKQTSVTDVDTYLSGYIMHRIISLYLLMLAP